MDTFDRVIRNMMSRFKGTATIVVPNDQEASYDASTSEYVTPEPTRYIVNAMVFDFTLQSNGLQVIKNTLIQTGDKQVFVQPLNKADAGLNMPKIRPEKDYVEIDGIQYNIVTCKELNPSGSDLMLYELLVRK